MLAPHALQPGSRLGRYELTRFLGEGGFAEVWLGRNTADASEHEVAIKVVRRGRVPAAIDRAMFLDEANIAASIRHPNVARVYEIGDEEGLPYLVMEHISGGSLETIRRGALTTGAPVPIAIGVTLLADTCAGLHAAHELVLDGRQQLVVHRDVSPQNILITESGVPKLIDFGIAKARERISKQTSAGVAKGKVAYMSPEQARGESIDQRADVWAIGAVLFELLEGRSLFTGPNEIARLQALVNRPVRPVFTHTPDRIAAVIKRALSFRARDRQDTVEEVRVELLEALTATGLGTSTSRSRSTARMRVAAERSAATTDAPDDLAELLRGAPAAATISVIVPGAPKARTRRAAAGILTTICASVAIAMAMRGAARARDGAATSPPADLPSASAVAVSAPSVSSPDIEPAASAVAAASAPASAGDLPTLVKAPRRAQGRAAPSPLGKPVAKPKASRHPADYAQIE